MKDTYVARVRDALPRGLCFRQQAWRGLIWPECPSLHGWSHMKELNQDIHKWNIGLSSEDQTESMHESP